jgi:perosamine synthetase
MTAKPRAVAAPAQIPLSAPYMFGNELAYVTEAVETTWVSTAGSFTSRFEADLARFVGTRRAVATNSGTAALHVALLLAGVEPGDEVAVSDMTFIAPVNTIRYAGAWPVFIDAEDAYWQMDVEALSRFLDQGCTGGRGELRNRLSGRRVRAILPVHLLGHPCDLDAIRSLGSRYDLPVIEDSTESLGALYRGSRVGSGGLSCLSFNGNKLVTTGGGGAIVTDDVELAERALYLTTQAKDDPLEYVHRTIGFNYRMPSLNAALGRGQLERIEDRLAWKRRIAGVYAEGLAGVDGVSPMPQAAWAEPAWWLYTIRVDPGRYGHDSRALMHHLAGIGIMSRPIFEPMHRSRAHEGCQAVGGAVADRIVAEALSLPSSVGLPESDQERVIDAIRDFGRR